MHSCGCTAFPTGPGDAVSDASAGGMVVAPSRYLGDDPGKYDLEIKHWDRQQEWFSWS